MINAVDNAVSTFSDKRLLEIERSAALGEVGESSSLLVHGHYTTSAQGSLTDVSGNSHETQRRTYELKISSLENQLATVKQEFSQHFLSAHELIAMQQEKLDELESQADNKKILKEMRRDIMALRQRQESFENFLSQPSPPKSVASSDWAETSSEASGNQVEQLKTDRPDPITVKRLKKYRPIGKMSQSYTAGSSGRTWQGPELTVPKFMTGAGSLSHSYTTGVLNRRTGANSVSSNSSGEFGYSFSASGSRRRKSHLEVSSRLFPKQDDSVPKFTFMRKYEGKSKPILKFPDYKPPDKNSIKSKLYPQNLEEQVGYRDFLKKYERNPPSPMDLPEYSPPDKAQIESELYPRHLSDQEPKFKEFLKKNESRTPTPPDGTEKRLSKVRRSSLHSERSTSSASSGLLFSPTGPKPSTSEPTSLTRKAKFSGDSFDGGLATSFEASRNGARGFETLNSSADWAFGGSQFPQKSGIGNNFSVEEFLNITAGWKSQPDYDESPTKFLKDKQSTNDNANLKLNFDAKFALGSKDLAESTQQLIEQSMNDDIFPLDYERQVSSSLPLKKVIRQRAEKRFLQRRDSGSSSYSDGSVGIIDDKTAGRDGQKTRLLDENGDEAEGFNSSLESGRLESFRDVISGSKLSKNDENEPMEEQLVKLPPILTHSFKSEQMTLNERVSLLNKPEFNLHDINLSSHGENSDVQDETGPESRMYSNLVESGSEPHSAKSVATEDSIGEVIEYGADTIELASERGNTPELDLSLPSASFQLSQSSPKFFPPGRNENNVNGEYNRVKFESVHGKAEVANDSVVITAEEIHTGANSPHFRLANNESPVQPSDSKTNLIATPAESLLGDSKLSSSQYLSESQLSVEGLLRDSIGGASAPEVMPHLELDGITQLNGHGTMTQSQLRSDSVSSADSQDFLDDSPSKKAHKVVMENVDNSEAQARLGHIGSFKHPSNHSDFVSRPYNGMKEDENGLHLDANWNGIGYKSSADRESLNEKDERDIDENRNVVDCSFEPNPIFSQWIECSTEVPFLREKSEFFIELEHSNDAASKRTEIHDQKRKDSFFDSQTDSEAVEDFSYLPVKVADHDQKSEVSASAQDGERLKDFVMPSRETKPNSEVLLAANEDLKTVDNNVSSNVCEFHVPFDQWHKETETTHDDMPTVNKGEIDLRNGLPEELNVELQTDDRSAAYESDFETDFTENVEESQEDSGINIDRRANGSALTERTKSNEMSECEDFQFRNADEISNEWCLDGSTNEESDSSPTYHIPSSQGPSREEFLAKPYESESYERDLAIPFMIRKLSQPQIIISVYEDVAKPSFSLSLLADQLEEMGNTNEFPITPNHQKISTDVPPAEFETDLPSWVEPEEIEEEIVAEVSPDIWETASIEQTAEVEPEVVEVLSETKENKIATFVVESTPVELSEHLVMQIKNWHDPGILYRSPSHLKNTETEPKVLEHFDDELEDEDVFSRSNPANEKKEEHKLDENLETLIYPGQPNEDDSQSNEKSSTINDNFEDRNFDNDEDMRTSALLMGNRLAQFTSELDRKSAELEGLFVPPEIQRENEEELPLDKTDESWPTVGESPTHVNALSSLSNETTSVWRDADHEPTFYSAYTLCYNDGFSDGLLELMEIDGNATFTSGENSEVKLTSQTLDDLGTDEQKLEEESLFEPQQMFSQWIENSSDVDNSAQKSIILQFEPAKDSKSPQAMSQSQEKFFETLDSMQDEDFSYLPEKEEKIPESVASTSSPHLSEDLKMPSRHEEPVQENSEFTIDPFSAQLQQWHNQTNDDNTIKSNSHDLKLVESSMVITYQSDGTFDWELNKQWQVPNEEGFEGWAKSDSDSPLNIRPLLESDRETSKSDGAVYIHQPSENPFHSALELINNDRRSSNRVPDYAKDNSDNSDSQEEILNVSFINGVPDEVSMETRPKETRTESDSSSFASSDDDNVVIQTTIISPNSQRHRIGVEGTDVVLIPLGVRSTERKNCSTDNRAYVHLSNSFPNLAQQQKSRSATRSLFENELIYNSARAVNLSMERISNRGSSAHSFERESAVATHDPNQLEELFSTKIPVNRSVRTGEMRETDRSRIYKSASEQQLDSGIPGSVTYVYVHGDEKEKNQVGEEEIGRISKIPRPTTLPSVRPMFDVLNDPEQPEKYRQDPYGVWRKETHTKDRFGEPNTDWKDEFNQGDDDYDDQSEAERQKKSVSWSDLSGKALELGPTVDRGAGNSPKPIIKPQRSSSQDSRGAFGTSLTRSESHSPSRQSNKTESFNRLSDSFPHSKDRTLDLLNCLHESQQTLNRAISQIITEAASPDSPGQIGQEIAGLPPQEAAKRLLLRLLLSPMADSRDASVQTEMTKDHVVVDKTPVDTTFSEELPFGQTLNESSALNKSTPNLSDFGGQEVVEPKEFRAWLNDLDALVRERERILESLGGDDNSLLVEASDLPTTSSTRSWSPDSFHLNTRLSRTTQRYLTDYKEQMLKLKGELDRKIADVREKLHRAKVPAGLEDLASNILVRAESSENLAKSRNSSRERLRNRPHNAEGIIRSPSVERSHRWHHRRGMTPMEQQRRLAELRKGLVQTSYHLPDGPDIGSTPLGDMAVSPGFSRSLLTGRRSTIGQFSPVSHSPVSNANGLLDEFRSLRLMSRLEIDNAFEDLQSSRIESHTRLALAS